MAVSTPESHPVSVRIPMDLYRRIETAAEAEDRTVSNWLLVAAKHRLEAHESREERMRRMAKTLEDIEARLSSYGVRLDEDPNRAMLVRDAEEETE